MNAPGSEAIRAVLEARETNPFMTTAYMVGGRLQVFGDVAAADRHEAIKKFGAVECELALALPDLQKTVRTALERRLRKLERAA